MSSAGSQSSDGRNAPALSLLRVLGRRWFHIVIAMVVCGVLGLAVSLVATPTYEASARVFLTLDANSDHSRTLETQAELATSTQAISDIAKKLRVSESYIAAHLTAAPAAAADYFTITGTSNNQKKADELVLTARDEYKALLVTYSGGGQATINDLTAKQEALQKEANGPNDPSGAIADAANRLLDQITTATVAQATATSMIGLAEPPSEAGKIAPKPFTNLLIAMLVGLFLAVAFVWIRYLRRPTVLDGRAAADAIGAPLIVGGSGPAAPSIDTIVSAMAAVLSPTVKVVSLTAAAQGDLTSDTVAGIAASWSDDQGVVLVLDASPSSDVRAVLERLPPATSGALPRWAHEATCMARSSGGGRGHVLYNRVSPSRASRPGGLAPILADRARDVDLVLLLTPSLTDLPMTAASALQADAVVVITSGFTRTDELAAVARDWPALSDRIVGVIHGDRGGFRPSTIAAESRAANRSSPSGSADRGRDRDRDYDRGDAEVESTDRFARPRY
ncbi:lipopolysaccharide biosynthesis protein [Frankia sp. AgB1.9]|uniref:Wzz/FepE/Etk N-terminal domain-containing protein n=1 Tax=unclassified Frankia TaxID=2632575 RepID=UPI00193488CB|nr:MULTISPECIES: Wzz/FepE/Etk N-terminal domain-containing protein [unclassified Frankia]MBL7487859.1 lipopolysaccharide biosynthesis protein [Frankia sp. AgW1.1]MBL7547161.1 lipopolysaccharide biosynthesis protein [Frankia sp. AgB1.9]MBL7620099.1 lipopolysaccharide biosynthesis protein [Frankia sp. AgB1.8]